MAETTITELALPAGFSMIMFLMLILSQIAYSTALIYAVARLLKLHDRKLKTALKAAAISSVAIMIAQNLIAGVAGTFLADGDALPPAMAAALVTAVWLAMLLINLFTIKMAYKIQKNRLLIAAIAWTVALFAANYFLLPAIITAAANAVLAAYPPQAILPPPT